LFDERLALGAPAVQCVEPLSKRVSVGQAPRRIAACRIRDVFANQRIHNVRLPSQGQRRLAVSDIDGLKAAAGRTVVATGTVSHVIEESGGGAVRYMRLFFKEAGNSVSARTYGFVPTFEGRYGDRGANIVGKTIEITSDFWVKFGWHLRAIISAVNVTA
jgi:hypothetical protein